MNVIKKNYLDCGIIEQISTRPTIVNLVVYKFNDNYSKEENSSVFLLVFSLYKKKENSPNFFWFSLFSYKRKTESWGEGENIL